MRALYLFLICSLAAPAAAQVVSTWVAPVDGDWSDSTNWSTDPIAPVAAGSEALINATGTPYIITTTFGVQADQITIDSPDATVLLNSGIQLKASDAINVSRGELVLGYGSVANTRLVGTAGVRTGHLPVFGQPNVTELRDVTLATSLQPIIGGSFNYLRVYDDLTLDDGTLYLQSDKEGGSRSFLLLRDGSSLVGTGEVIVTQPNVTAPFVSCCSADAYFYVAGDSSMTSEIGPGVTVRAEQGAQLTIDDFGATGPIERLNNYGVVEAVGGSVRMNSNLAFSNYGLLRAVDGGRMHLYFHSGPAGEVEIGAGSEIAFLGGNVRFNQPFTVPQDGRLRLRNGWSSETEITIDGGVVRLEQTATEHGNWVWQNGGTLEIANTITPADLVGFDTTATTQILFGAGALFLGGGDFDLSSVPGQWNFERAQIVDGVLVGLPNGNAISSESDDLILVDTSLSMPLRVEAGSVELSGTSSVDQPMTLVGGRVKLFDDWINSGGITVAGGRLELGSIPTSTGNIVVNSGELAISTLPAGPLGIVFNGGVLETQFHTTLTELTSLPWTPEAVAIGLLSNQSGSLDLEGATIDVAGQPWGLTLHGGEVRNGVLWKSTDDGPWLVKGGDFSDVTVQTDIRAEGQVDLEGEVVLDGIRLEGEYRVVNASNSSLTLDGVTIDGVLTAGSIHGTPPPVEAKNLTVNGGLQLGTRILRMEGAQTLSGTGVVSTDGIRSAPGGGVEVMGGNLTIGEGFTFRSERNGSRVTTDWATIYNQGSIIAAEDDYQNGTDVLAPSITIVASNGVQGAFVQQGLLQIANGYEIRVETHNFQNEGEIEIRGGLLTAASEQLSNLGSIRGDGTIISTNNLFWNWGSVTIGDHGIADEAEQVGAVGILNVVGDFTQGPDGSLLLDLAGTAVGVEYDRLSISGLASLDGLLVVSLLDDFFPTLGHSFELIAASDGLDGTFAQFDLPDLGSSLAWEILYGSTTVSLTVVAATLPGDFNSDSVINGADFLFWQRDPSVGNLSDWQSSYGDTMLTVSASTVVPEPSALMLALVAALLHVMRPDTGS